VKTRLAKTPREFRLVASYLGNAGSDSQWGQMPDGFLRDIQVTVQFHTGNALDTCTHDVYGNCPYLISQVATLHIGSYTYTEPFTADSFSAPVGHIRMGSHCLVVC